jgi:hypothetical protein
MGEPVWSTSERVKPQATVRGKLGLGLVLVGAVFLLGPMFLAPFGLPFTVGGIVAAWRDGSTTGLVAKVAGALVTVALLLAIAPVG